MLIFTWYSYSLRGGMYRGYYCLVVLGLQAITVGASITAVRSSVSLRTEYWFCGTSITLRSLLFSNGLVQGNGLLVLATRASDCE